MRDKPVKAALKPINLERTAWYALVLAVVILASFVPACLNAAPASAGEVVSWGWYVLLPWDTGMVFSQVADGNQHTVALRRDGTVVAWGLDDVGECLPPSGLSNVVAISAGSYHTLALKTNGTVVAWGANSHGQTNVPSTLSNVTAVAAGQYFSLALQSNGTVAGWGDAPSLAGISNVVAIAAGGDQCIALLTNGTVVTSGTDPGFPTPPTDLTNIIGVAVSGNSSPGTETMLALRRDGTVVAWGDGDFGKADPPPDVTNVVAIAGGGYHCMALRSDGTVVAWGAGTLNFGVLFEFGQSIVPAGLSNIVSIAGGGAFSSAVKSDGTLVSWGGDLDGELLTPGTLRNVSTVVAGGASGLALKRDGTVVGWGDCDTTSPNGNLAAPAGLSNVVAIAAGSTFSLVLKSDGTVVSWGEKIPLPSGLSNIVAIAAGDQLAWALTRDGTLVGTGISGLTNVTEIAGGDEGALALNTDGTIISLAGPPPPAGLTNVTGIAVGSFDEMALLKDGTVIEWGYDAGGNTNVPPTLTNALAISARDHSVALTPDGHVTGWGNYYDESIQAAILPGMSNLVAISAGYTYTLGLRADLAVDSLTISNQNPTIHFHTFAGQQYAVQTTSDLRSPDWEDLAGSSIPGTGFETTVSDTNSLNRTTSRFYRIRVVGH